MFNKLPDGMIHYVTYELAEMLVELSPQQRSAIDRIVQQHHMQARPMAELFRGDDKICSENNYYKRGQLDAETGEWRKQGWAHQEKFQAALKEATRLALQSREREKLEKLRLAKGLAVDEAQNAVRTWVHVMRDDNQKGADRNAAAEKLLELAFKDGEGEQAQSAGSVLDDWWKAAEG